MYYALYISIIYIIYNILKIKNIPLETNSVGFASPSLNNVLDRIYSYPLICLDYQ